MDERYRVSALEIDGWGDGDLGYIQIINGRSVFVRLPVPADWSTTPYVLGVVGGFPAWVVAEAGVIAYGYGNSFGNVYGGPA